MQITSAVSYWIPSTISDKSADRSLSDDLRTSLNELDPLIRTTLGTNSYLSDETLIVSWRYVFSMIGYCIIATIIGVLSITLLPDPETLELIRNGGDDDYQDTMDASAQKMAAAYDTYKPTDEDVAGGEYGYGTDEVNHDIIDPGYHSYVSYEKHGPNYLDNYMKVYHKYRKDLDDKLQDQKQKHNEYRYSSSHSSSPEESDEKYEHDLRGYKAPQPPPFMKFPDSSEPTIASHFKTISGSSSHYIPNVDN